MSIIEPSVTIPDFDLPPVNVLREDSTHPVLLLCEHASHYIPPAYENLGLANGVEATHIGWDIGALELAERLSDRLNATLISAGYSRLLIDLNRPLHAKDSIPTKSDNQEIPGNVTLSKADKDARQRFLFEAFHQRVSNLLDRRLTQGIPTRVVSVHSFTPTMNGVSRPWELGVLYDKAREYAQGIMIPLAEQGIVVGNNQPYQVHPDEDVAVPVHGDARGLPCVLLELRNDLLSQNSAIDAWVNKLAPLL